jgi:predicted Zn-dependent protease with MMP-like domain
MQEARIHHVGSLVAALVAGTLGAPAALAAPFQGAREAANRVPARSLVAAARDRAAAKLRRPECREVLSDFRDAAGRRLSEILEERRVGAAEFLSSLVFVDGRATALCQRGNVAAGANPGSIYIGVCKETFARVEATDPGLATNGVIHEMLHALGLGENPPTSEEITRQVVRRCGR